MFISFMLHGYGGEVVLGKISKKAAVFWKSDEMEEHFHDYVFNGEWWEDENPNIKIPKYAQMSPNMHRKLQIVVPNFEKLLVLYYLSTFNLL